MQVLPAVFILLVVVAAAGPLITALAAFLFVSRSFEKLLKFAHDNRPIGSTVAHVVAADAAAQKALAEERAAERKREIAELKARVAEAEMQSSGGTRLRALEG